MFSPPGLLAYRFSARAYQPELGLWVWIALLATLPLLVFAGIRPNVLNSIYIEPKAHGLVEAFCGFVAYLIACLLAAVALRQRDRSMWLFAIGFLAMGVLDTVHALTDPMVSPVAFVGYHTASTLAGALFITLGLVDQASRRYELTAKDLRSVALGIVLLLTIAALYHAIVPRFMVHEQPDDFRFSAAAHYVHGLAALLYGVSALLLYRLYRVTGQVLMLVVASFVVLFAQSALLFSVSNMWDFPWWMWHGVKVLFYLGILVSLAVGFLLTLDAMQRSRLKLMRANAHIKRSHRRIHKVNRELQSRNQMVFEAIEALDLPHALEVIGHAVSQYIGVGRFELVLLVPEDRVGELSTSPQFSGAHHRVRVQAQSESLHTHRRSGDLVWLGAASDTEGRGLCLDLVAHGRCFGYLKFFDVSEETFSGHHAELNPLASEAGAIIHNALMYLEWQQESEFRTAVLRVSTMITSTLSLTLVLETVCRESARLLEADGALVWLPKRGAREFSMAARWFEPGKDDPCGAEAWCKGGKLCEPLLASIEHQYRPRAWLLGNDWMSEQATGIAGPGKSVALFPLVDDENLVGVMMLVRHDLVPFSDITLSKGELLAGQVRIAIGNARSYSQLGEINEQLLAMEATKIRNERLAALGQMAASVAHEVRNPLSAIANCVSVLKAECSEGGRARTALGIIEDEVYRLDKLARDFLIFGKPRPISRKPVAVDALLHKVCSALEHHIVREELPVSVAVSVRTGSSLVALDADALEIVLWNLLLNAVQAIAGPGQVNASVAVRSGHIFFAITDSGKGISAAEREHIFEPFYSQRSHGAGLGLAIVQRYVQDWHGQIRLRSAPGQGTTVFLRIPAA